MLNQPVHWTTSTGSSWTLAACCTTSITTRPPRPLPLWAIRISHPCTIRLPNRRGSTTNWKREPSTARRFTAIWPALPSRHDHGPNPRSLVLHPDGHAAARAHFVTALGQRTRLFLLSNTNAIHAAVFEADLHSTLDDASAFWGAFEQAHYSHDLGMKKPIQKPSWRCVKNTDSRPRKDLVFGRQHPACGRRRSGGFARPPPRLVPRGFRGLDVAHGLADLEKRVSPSFPQTSRRVHRGAQKARASLLVRK